MAVSKNLICVLNPTLCLVLLVAFVHESYSINLGLFAGDNKKHSSPLVIKKTSRHAPVFINIHPSLPQINRQLSLPKIPSKPPPLKLSKLKIPKLRSLSRILPRKPKPLLIPPAIPKIPFLPIIPPLLPPLPFVPPLPILPPFPILPLLLPKPLRLPKIPSGLRPLKVPILTKTALQKALGSEMRPTIVPLKDLDIKDNVLKKLKELRRSGALTTAEFIRFRKLLLR